MTITLLEEFDLAERPTDRSPVPLPRPNGNRHGRGSCFEMQARRINGARIIFASGNLHLGHATRELREAVRTELDRGTTILLLDLGRVTSIDSAGLGELVGAQTAAQRAGATLKIVGPSTRIESMLRLTRLLSVFDIWPDEASAIESLTRSDPGRNP